MEIDNEVSEADRPRSPMGWRKRIGWGVLIVALLAAIILLCNRQKKASKLQTMLAELDRDEPGWRLDDIEAARAKVSEEENSANVVVAAARFLPSSWPPKDLSEEHFQLLPPPEMLSDREFARLSKELQRLWPALTTAARLVDMPRGRPRLCYERCSFATKLPHLEDSRRLVTLLAYESMRHSQNGQSKEALTVCRAALNAARSIGDEPFAVSQAVRNTGVIHACQAIERALGQGEPPSQSMEALQKLLANEDTFPSLLTGTRGQRAIVNQLFELLEKGELSRKELDGILQRKWNIRGLSQRLNWLERAFAMGTPRDHVLFLSLMERRIKEIQFPMHEQAELERRFEGDVRKMPKSAVLTHFFMRFFRGGRQFHQRKHAYLRCTIAALAAERYRRDKKTWPDKIDNLCPEYLDDVPLDPFDGHPLRYRRLEDGVLIYSVGVDAVDNGGHLDRERPTSPGVDLGVRLWDVDKRRQPPRAKTPVLKPR